ncbi:MAG TPA: PKD domain-containing protein, partial [Segetibacter sp.]
MRGKVFLLSPFCKKILISQLVRVAFPTNSNNLLILLLPILFAFLPQVVKAQEAVTGMKVYGKIVNSGDTVQVCVGGQVAYENSAQGQSVRWQFNLGTPASGAQGSFYNVRYTREGIDSTIQTVISGLDTAKMFVIVKVNNQKPRPAFSFTQPDSCGNIPIAFNSLGSAGNPDIIKYKWDFGDGSTDTIPNPSHQFL